jgi:hypothetical protein
MEEKIKKIIIIIIVLIIGGFLIWFSSDTIKELMILENPEEGIIKKELVGDESTNWQVYRNNKYGWEIEYPLDWRLANSIMEWEQDFSIDSEKTTDDWVMITNLSKKEEEILLEKLKNLEGSMGHPLDCINDENGRAIIIRPTWLDPSDVRETESLGFLTGDVKEEITEQGLKVVRSIRLQTWETYRNVEEALFPYSRDEKLIIDDREVMSILLEINRNIPISNSYPLWDEEKSYNYEKETFDQVVQSFRFID